LGVNQGGFIVFGYRSKEKGSRSIATLVVVIIAILGVPVACQSEPSLEDSVSRSAESFNEGDFEDALGYYTDDVEFEYRLAIPPYLDDSYQGRDALLGMFEEMAARNMRKEIEIQKVVGNQVTASVKITDDLTEALGIDPLDYEEAYTFVEGKVKWVVSTIDNESVVNYMRAVPLESTAILGRWRMDDGGHVQFNDDDTYQLAVQASDLDSSPLDSGTYAVEGSLVYITSDEAANNCQSGDVGTYLFQALEDGRLKSDMLADECDFRSHYAAILTRIEGDS
jgi:hypothetical protein